MPRPESKGGTPMTATPSPPDLPASTTRVFCHGCGVCGAHWVLEKANLAQIECLLEIVGRTHLHTPEQISESLLAGGVQGGGV